MVHFVAREPHFVDHLVPVWRELAPWGAQFWVPHELQDHARRRGVAFPRSYGIRRVRIVPGAADRQLLTARLVRSGGRPWIQRRVVKTRVPVWVREEFRTPLRLPRGAPCVVASIGDLRSVADGHRPLALFEHGAGQSYGNRHPSYCDSRSPDRAQVELFAVPNEYAAARCRRAHPEARVRLVGCPKLDPWHAGWRPPPIGERPTVAISFHWDCRVAPETRGCFRHYRKALGRLAQEFRVLGHGHPRLLPRIAHEYRSRGIEVVSDFEDVLRQAHVYAVDNSSTLFEFASTDRPVVVLNAPWFRRHVEHGLRFWRHADVGVGCDEPESLVDAVREALRDLPEQRRRRRLASDAVYAFRDGRCARRAAREVVDWLVSRQRGSRARRRLRASSQ